MTGFSDIALWNIILGFLGPIIIAFVARPTMAPITKIIIQVLFSIFVGGVTVWLSDAFTGRTLVSSILLVLATSILSYKGFWKPIGVADSLEAGVNGGNADLAVVDQSDETLPDAEDTSPQDFPKM